jgi:hypothetical protein
MANKAPRTRVSTMIPRFVSVVAAEGTRTRTMGRIGGIHEHVRADDVELPALGTGRRIPGGKVVL